MKKIVFLILFVCLIHITSFSQSSFYNFYPDTLTGATLQKAIPTHDHGFISFGGGSIIVLNKFDSSGVSTWSKEYAVAGYDLYPCDIIEMQNHDFMITGIYSHINNTINTFLLMRVDSAGNLRYAKIDHDSTRVYGYPLGGVNITGTTPDDGVVFTGQIGVDSLQGEFFFLAKTDSVGNAVWFNISQPDTNVSFDYIRSAMTANGEMIITGFYSYFNVDPSLSYFFAEKFEPSGNHLWTKRSVLESHMPSISDRVIEKDNNYYVLTSQDSPLSVLNVANIYKLTTNGQLVWHSHYNFCTGFSSLNLMMKTSDGRISFMARDNSIYGNNMNVEIDNSGAIVNSQVYAGWPFNKILHNNFETSPGKFVTYGFMNDFISFGLIFLSLDSLYRFPCLSSGIQLPAPTFYNDSTISMMGSFYVATNAFSDISSFIQTSIFVLTSIDFCNLNSSTEFDEEKNLVISPNPATNSITISSKDFSGKNGLIEIYNTLGEKIYSTAYNFQPQTINLKLPPGIYFVRLSDSEKQLTKKLVIE